MWLTGQGSYVPSAVYDHAGLPVRRLTRRVPTGRAFEAVPFIKPLALPEVSDFLQGSYLGVKC